MAIAVDNLADAESLTAIEKEAEEEAEKNKSHSGSPARDDECEECGTHDGGNETGGEEEGGGTDLEHDLNETMEDYEAALDTEGYYYLCSSYLIIVIEKTSENKNSK